MIIKYNKKNVDDQTTDFELKLSDPELNFLVNFAIESLIQMGAIAVQQNSEEEQIVSLPLEPVAIIPDTPTSAH